MPRLNWIVALASGVAIGVATVIACGNGAGPADAQDAGCNCPPVEPFESRLTLRDGDTAVFFDAASEGERREDGRSCEVGEVAISGSCAIDPPGNGSIYLQEVKRTESGGREGYYCRWYNPSGSGGPYPITVRAQVLCYRTGQ